MAKILYYDASAGISGDMNLAALVELGVDFGYLCAELEKLNLAGEFKLVRKNVLKNGIAATKIDVVCAGRRGEIPLGISSGKFCSNGLSGVKFEADRCENIRQSTHTKFHSHSRNLGQILKLVETSQLSAFVKDMAGKIFKQIATAEAKMHGVSVWDVHFHEIGAIDSIVDVVGAAICIEALGVPQIFTSQIELGGGFVRCAHGKLAVPAPATAEILRGASVSLGRADFEMATPTGAAILKVCARNLSDTDHREAPQNFKILSVGYGAGDKDAADFANVLRVMLCETDEERGEGDERNLSEKAGYGEVCKQILISTNIDDMDAESFALACEILRENGALDVFSRSIFMKKGRMGYELNALCRKQDAQNLKDLIFTHTTAIGVREVEVAKTELKREFVRVQTKFGEIGLKISGSGQTQKAKPEFDECKAAALAHGTTIERVRKEALKIYDETRKTKG
ncbi:nickel pincer cofactor biosynthesis protein LarC [Campylobacter rectus]|uniref:nickel pincer cofactor biosynthesis protein LarC n=1 Tax=Campylobacter rectus TaxID=203 RepID=UPI0028DC29BA|nr:nickel pincer cofactor biosynthesis protein LarC [Campylobacter rectus]